MMISGKVKGMAFGRMTEKWMPGLVIAALFALMVYPSPAAADEFEDIWKEGPNGPPRQMELDKERLDQLVKHVAEGNSQREEQLRQLYTKDRDKFWSEVRAFFGKQQEQGGRSEGGRQVESGGGGPGGGGPGRGGARDGQGGPRSSRWREEQLKRRHDEFISWLKENFPDIEKDLSQYSDKPEEYFKRFSEVKDKYEHVMMTQKRDPELAKVLKEEIELTDYRNELLKDIRRADKKKRQQLIEQLTVVVSRRFDLIVRKKQLQFEELHRRLERLQKELAEREKELGNLIESKEEATKSRIKVLLDPKQKVEWK